MTSISTIMLIRSGTPEYLQKKKELWAYIQEYYPWAYRRLRCRALGVCLNLPGKTGRRVAVTGYKVSRKVFGFN